MHLSGEHMKQTAIFPGRYVQQPGVLANLGTELAHLGKSALIVAGGTAYDRLIPQHADAWATQLTFTVERFRGECLDDEIQRLAASATDCDMIIGIGGGKVIDTAKAVGNAVGARVAIVPTIASTDAPTSAVSVIYTAAGQFDRCLFLTQNPDVVLVDSDVIAQAPDRFLVAGMGDALATWFEADACRQAYSHNQCGGNATLAALSLARLCFDTILQYGVAAQASCQQNIVTPALEHVIEANTLLSGLGFESGGLAAAHSIHNGLTRLSGTHAFYHGEKVAIGVLAGLFLTDRPPSLIDEVYDFCESVGLPTTLADIGIAAATDDELLLVAEGACAEGETIHNEPYPVTAAAVVAALRTADQVGRLRGGDQT